MLGTLFAILQFDHSQDVKTLEISHRNHCNRNLSHRNLEQHWWKLFGKSGDKCSRIISSLKHNIFKWPVVHWNLITYSRLHVILYYPALYVVTHRCVWSGHIAIIIHCKPNFRMLCQFYWKKKSNSKAENVMRGCITFLRVL